jgi:cysteine synthase
MSVIARAPDGTIRLYCKGSDAKVLQKIRRDTPPELMDNTNANLHYFAKQVWRGEGLGWAACVAWLAGFDGGSSSSSSLYMCYSCADQLPAQSALVLLGADHAALRSGML